MTVTLLVVIVSQINSMFLAFLGVYATPTTCCVQQPATTLAFIMIATSRGFTQRPTSVASGIIVSDVDRAEQNVQ
jgi:hypothetical protein